MIPKMSMAFGHKKFMEALLAAGAEVDSKDGNGRTAMSVVGRWGGCEC